VRGRILRLLAALWLLLPAATALAGETTPAAGPTDPNAISSPATLDGYPAAHRLNGLAALAIARRDPRIQTALREHPTARPEVYLKGQARWQVSWFTPGSGKARKEIAQVLVDDATGKVTEAWTGPQVAWTMARGYPGAFGRAVNSPWVWIPLTVLFIVPFLDPRRPLRWLHLDLAVLAAFGISVAFFNAANLGVSVPLVAPLMAYLLVRALAVGYRSRKETAAARGPLPLLVPVSWLAIALVFLVGFRIGLNLEDSNVIDVGYSGVIGAHKLAAGDPLYGHFPSDDASGDTYGPVAYEAYVPFEQLLPWHGKWAGLWAANAASISFDLLTLLTLIGIGWRIRGPGMGVVLGYAWATWPFSLYAMNSNSNDGLVALFVALALLLAARPAARGVAAALGAMTKFGSLALLPVFALHDRQAGRRGGLIAFSLAALATLAVVWLPVIAGGESLRTVYDRTIAFQFGRDAPFSVWGLYGWSLAQHAWQLLTVAFIVAAPFLPRRRDVVGLAAVCAAILLAVLLSVTYWFYLYLVWMFPALIVALLARHEAPLRRHATRVVSAAGAPESAAAGSLWPPGEHRS